MTEILLADKGMRVSHSAMKSNSSEKSLTETWQKQLLLNCGLHITHTHTAHLLTGAIFCKADVSPVFSITVASI